MSDAQSTDHLTHDAAGRHRGTASADDAEKTPPHGKHRRTSED